MMRFAMTIMLLIGGLALVRPAYSQGTGASTAGPKQATPPTARRQPRQADVIPSRRAPDSPPPATDANPTPSDATEQDERLNRILNSICRGC